MKKIVLMVGIVLCTMLTGCSLFTEKCEITHTEARYIEGHPICEIELDLESDN